MPTESVDILIAGAGPCGLALASELTRSTVREQAGIDFEGAGYEEAFALADVHMDWPLSPEEVTLFYSPAGLVVVAPIPHQRFRIVATVKQAPQAPTL
jgi:2-polyprenyl-6-methoxyphenol hydroxylase-like FAD-dependent oxidoreductase